LNKSFLPRFKEIWRYFCIKIMTQITLVVMLKLRWVYSNKDILFMIVVQQVIYDVCYFFLYKMWIHLSKPWCGESYVISSVVVGRRPKAAMKHILIGLGVSWCRICIVSDIDIYDYIELCHFLKLLSVSMSICVRVDVNMCPCLCFIATI